MELFQNEAYQREDGTYVNVLGQSLLLDMRLIRKKRFGAGVEVDPFGAKIVLRHKKIRVRIPIVNWQKRDTKS